MPDISEGGVMMSGSRIEELLKSATGQSANVTSAQSRVEELLHTLIQNGGSGSGGGVSSEYVQAEIAKLVNNAPEAYDTLKEISDWIVEHGDEKQTCIQSVPKYPNWVNNGISAYDGSITSNTARLKTVEPLEKDICAIEVSNDLQFGVFGYSGNTYVGWWTGSEWSKIAISWKTGTCILKYEDVMNLDIYMVVRKSSGDISAQEVSGKIKFRTIIDLTDVLTKPATIIPEIRNGTNRSISGENAIATMNILPVMGAS